MFRITSKQEGKFNIKAKYMGGALTTLEFTHEELITLLQDAESGQPYQELLKKLEYKRDGNLLAMGRAFAFDVTRLLPYLYECFAKQQLADKGEKMVQEKQLGRLEAVANASKGGGGGGGATPAAAGSSVDPAMAQHVKELEELERSMSGKGGKKKR